MPFRTPSGAARWGGPCPTGSCWPPWPATPMRGRAGSGAGVRKSDDGAISGRAGPHDKNRVRFLVCQYVEDELAAGAQLKELADYAGTSAGADFCLRAGGWSEMRRLRRLSGITANPQWVGFPTAHRLGRLYCLTEVPEMFVRNPSLRPLQGSAVFDKAVQMVEALSATLSPRPGSL